MASRTQVLLEDDLDGGQADETMRFAFDGKAYIIDLSTKNAAKLRKAMAPFVDAARRETSTPSHGSRRSVPAGVEPSAVRAWATSNGHKVSARGRIRADVVAAFQAAGN